MMCDRQHLSSQQRKRTTTTPTSMGKKTKETTVASPKKDDGNEKETKPPVALDGGTLNVARGKSAKEVKRERKELAKQLSETPGAAARYASEEARARLSNLKEDDKAPDLSGLNDKQKRAFEKRRQRGGDVMTQTRLARIEAQRMKASIQAAQAAELLETAQTGMVEAENDMERTSALTQQQLKRDHLDQETARHIFQLDLAATAPYGMKYDRSGRYSILYGQTGHLALMDNHQQSLATEFNVNERVRDACFLHNFTMFAAAQKNNVFIYDYQGTEIHRLKEHADPMALEFLPYHWLLASIGRAGWLRYVDTSTGEAVSKHRTQMGACSVLRQNPINAVSHAGHANGTVTLWSPASNRYLAKMHCHKGAAIHSMAISPDGHTMVTGGADRQVKIWDLRMFRERHSYLAMAGIPTSLDISQTGMLAVAHAGHADIWSARALQYKAKAPYMHHAMPRCSPVETVRFRPFEDVCGIGHARGMDSIVIPGSGSAQLETMEYDLNPAADAKQLREAEVRALLDKLMPRMITLDTNLIGGIEESNPHAEAERARDLQEQANAREQPQKKHKTKKRGQSKIATQLRRKRKNVLDENTVKLKQAREEEKAAVEEHPPSQQDSAPAALRRFFK